MQPLTEISGHIQYMTEKVANGSEKRSRTPLFLALLTVLIPFSIVYTPSVWINVMLFVDFYTPWIAFESPMYEAYHTFLVNRLEERDEKPLIEISKEEATLENIIKLSKGFTW